MAALALAPVTKQMRCAAAYNMVIPSDSRGPRHETFKVTQRDPSVRAGLAFSLGMTNDNVARDSASRFELLLR